MDRLFTLEEARALIPHLRGLIQSANDDLEVILKTLERANQDFDQAESRLDRAGSRDEPNERLRACRAGYELAVENLSVAQKEYMERLDMWLIKIADTGVVLRDLREGLVDFPARKDQLDYLLCWRMNEPDITFWHLASDGFSGRKPLAALAEFF